MNPDINWSDQGIIEAIKNWAKSILDFIEIVKRIEDFEMVELMPMTLLNESEEQQVVGQEVTDELDA